MAAIKIDENIHCDAKFIKLLKDELIKNKINKNLDDIKRVVKYMQRMENKYDPVKKEFLAITIMCTPHLLGHFPKNGENDTFVVDCEEILLYQIIHLKQN